MTLDTSLVDEIDIQEIDCFSKSGTVYFETNDPFYIDFEFSVTNISENDKEDQAMYGKFDFDVTIGICHYCPEDDDTKGEPFVDLENYVTDKQFDQILNRIESDVQDYMTKRSIK